MMPTEKDAIRFLGKVRLTDEPHPVLGTPCHLWQGGTNGERKASVKSGGSRGGYGVFWMFGKSHRAHRVSFAIAYGRWPANALHACDTPACVNPLHLRDGSRGDNLRDAWARGRRGKRLSMAS